VYVLVEDQSAVAAFKDYSGEGVLQWFVAMAMCVMVKHINVLKLPVKRTSQLWLPSKTTQEKVCCSGFVAVAMCVMVKHINMLRVPVKRYSQSWLPSKTTQEKVCCSGLWRWPCA